jgi:Zn finger protein HypA/HybF involved in hydrogenase expression
MLMHTEVHVLGRDGGNFLCGSKDELPSYKFLRQCKRCGSAAQWVIDVSDPTLSKLGVQNVPLAECSTCSLVLMVEPKNVHCQQCEERGF